MYFAIFWHRGRIQGQGQASGPAILHICCILYSLHIFVYIYICVYIYIYIYVDVEKYNQLLYNYETIEHVKKSYAMQ